MKPKGRASTDEMRPEYDFDYATGVRGKYRERVRGDVTVVVLDRDVARAFRSAAAVNAALRCLLDMSESTRKLISRTRPRRLSRTSAKGARRAARR